MSEHHADELLSRYLDGDLTPVEAGRIAEHVAVCLACRRILAQLREVRDAAGALEQLEPPERTWTAIQQRLAGCRQGVRLGRRQVRRWVRLGLPMLVAAGLLLALFWGRSGVSRPETRAKIFRFAQSDRVWPAGRDDAQTAAAVRRSPFAVELVCRGYMAGIDQAIRECEAALEENPGNLRVRRAWLGAQADRAHATDRLVSWGD